MKLLEFSYKNILSYGNLIQRFEFNDEPQLVLVSGENGSGKSSIKEALTVSIYGRSAIRKMKDIPNWINRNAYTQVKFITNSGELIEIDRGIDPNFSNIKINGAEFNLPDKRKVDEFIEDELAKIPFPVFCNTISLSFDDFKSFVNLSQADKRKIVDRIFGIDILSDMRVIVKDQLKSYKKDFDILEAQISKNKESLQKSRDQLDLLKEKLSKKKESKSDLYTSQIDNKQTELNTVKEKYTAVKKETQDLELEINTFRDEMSKNKTLIVDLGEKLKLYQKNRCPHCLNDLTSDSSLKTKEIIETRKKALEENFPSIKEKFNDLTTKLSELVDSREEYKGEYYKINAEIDSLKKELGRVLEEIESDQTDSIQEIIKSISLEISEDEASNQKSKESVTLFQTLDDLLSDSGIKKTLIDKIIPTLNARILEISERLEFKFSFSFDSDFNPFITYLGMEVSPESLSSGQRKKMNLIVLLAFIELIKMKHNNMNIMFLDEIFSSLDRNNVYKAIEILKEYSEKYGMTIFVVSHESLPEEFFNSRIEVTTNDHFSEMKITRVGEKLAEPSQEKVY